MSCPTVELPEHPHRILHRPPLVEVVLPRTKSMPVSLRTKSMPVSLPACQPGCTRTGHGTIRHYGEAEEPCCRRSWSTWRTQSRWSRWSRLLREDDGGGAPCLRETRRPGSLGEEETEATGVTEPIGFWVDLFKKLPTWHGFLPHGVCRRLPYEVQTVVSVDLDFLKASRAR